MIGRFCAFTLSLSLMIGSSAVVFAEEDGSPDQQMMTEGELALELVEVLGLSSFLSAAPTKQESQALLLSNGISPKDGWNSTNLVTVGNLARILVQSLDAVDQIENPDEDKAYVDYLASVGIEFGTVQDAIDQMDPLSQPLGNEAIVVSTDPLKKKSLVRTAGEQQMGADLDFYKRPISVAEFREVVVEPEPPPAKKPSKPKPMTPNRLATLLNLLRTATPSSN